MPPKLSSKERQDMKLGPTNQFPEGKLVPHDEGELKFAIGSRDGCVVMEFGSPVKWFGCPPGVAREMARLLVKHADALERTKAH
jgi:hypothetical protein